MWECLQFVIGWKRRSFFLLRAPTSDTSTLSAAILMKLTRLFTHLSELSRLEHFRDIIWIVYHFTHQLKWNGIYGREDFPQELKLDQFGISLPSDYGSFTLTLFLCVCASQYAFMVNILALLDKLTSAWRLQWETHAESDIHCKKKKTEIIIDWTVLNWKIMRSTLWLNWLTECSEAKKKENGEPAKRSFSVTNVWYRIHCSLIIHNPSFILSCHDNSDSYITHLNTL